MDQELLDLLYDAYSQGASQEDLDELYNWYSSGKKDSPEVSADTVVAPQDSTTGLPDFMLPQQGGAVSEPNKPRTPVTDFGVAVYSGVVDDIPSAYYGAGAIGTPTSFDEHLAAVERGAQGKGGRNTIQTPSKGLSRTMQTPEQRAKTAAENYRAKVGDEQYLKEKQEYESGQINSKLDLFKKSQEQRKQGEEKLQGRVQSLRDINEAADVPELVSTTLGKALTFSIASLGTYGMYAYEAGGSEIYNEALERQAKSMTEQLGKEITPEDIIKLGLDNDAKSYADIFGRVNAALEYVAIGKVFGPVLRKVLGRQITEQVAKRGFSKQLLEAGGTEGLTGLIQDVDTQIASQLAAGAELKDLDVDWARAFDAAGLEAIGGIGLGAPGAVSQIKTRPGKEGTGEISTPVDLTKQKGKILEVQQQVKTNEKAEIRIDDSIDDVTNDLDPDVSTEIEDNTDNLISDIKALMAEQKIEKEIAKEEQKVIKEETKEPILETEPNVTATQTQVEEQKEAEKEVKKDDKKVERKVRGRKQKGKTTKQAAKQTGGKEAPTGDRILQAQEQLKQRKSEITQALTEEPAESVVAEDYYNELADINDRLEQYEKERQKEEGILKDEGKAETQKTPEAAITPEQATTIQGQKKKPAQTEKQLRAIKAKEKLTGKKVLAEEKATETGVEGQLRPEVSGEAIESERIKLNDMFERRRTFPRPSERLKRLKHMLDTTIPKSKYPEQHEELKEKIQKEIDKQSSTKETIKEERKEREAKRISKKEKVQDKPSEKEVQDKQQKAKRQRRLDSLYTEVARAVDTGNNNIITTAVNRVNAYRGEEGLRPLERDRIIEKSSAELYQTRKKNRQKYKDAGLDDDVIDAIENPDQEVLLEARDLNIPDSDIEERTAATWSNLEEVKEGDITKELSTGIEAIENTPWSGVVDKMIAVVKTAAKDGNFRVFKGKSKGREVGRGIKSGDQYIILLNKERGQDRTAFHELTHLFEFALMALQNEDVVSSQVFKNINNLYYDVLNSFAKEIDVISNYINKYGNKWEDWRIGKLDKYQQALYYYIHANVEGASNLTPIEAAKSYIDYLRNNPNVVGTETSPVYGLTNPREMVAEAISNPSFAGILAHMAPEGFQKTNSPRTSLLAKIYNALVDTINKTIDFLNKEIGLNLSTFDNLDNTYLGYLLDELDIALESVIDKIEAGVSPKTAFKESSIEAAMAIPKKGVGSKIAEKVVDTAISRDLNSIQQLRELVKEIQNKVGQEFSPAVKGAITRRFKTFLNKKKFLNNSDQIIGNIKSGDRYKNSPPYRNIVNGLEEINKDGLTQKERNNYVDALIALLSGDIKKLRSAKNFIQKQQAKSATETIIDTKSGLGFNDFNSGIRKLFKNWVNFPTFLAYISKYNKEKAPLLMKTFHNNISTPYSYANIDANDYMDSLNKIANKNKLREPNFNRIYFYGVIKRQGLDAIEDERRYLQNKLEAVQKGYDKRFNEAEIVRQLSDYDVIAEAIKEGKEPLTAAEQEYYDSAREILETLAPGIEDNTTIIWGEKFERNPNYIPTVAMGSIPVDNKGVETTINIGEQSLTDILKYAEIPTDRNVSGTQSSFTYKKRGGRGAYYDTNIHTVMARYLNSTLFDMYGTYNIQKLNKILHGTNRAKLDNISNGGIGVDNMRIIQDSLIRAVNFAIRPHVSYSTFTKAIIKGKNMIMSGKIGTSGQFITQYLGMLPATMAATSVNSFQKALTHQAKLLADSDLRKEFDDFIRNNTGELGIRDFFFERYESPEEIARRGVGGKIRRLADTIENKTVTKIISMSDKWSVRLTWLSAFIDAGGDINNKATWTPERLASADLKAAQIQNVSSGLFAPEVLYKQKEGEALLATALWSFRSFSLNSMANFWLSVPTYFSNAESRKITNSMIASSLGYEASTMLVLGGYGWLASALFGDDDNEPKDEKEMADSLVSSFYNLFFGGMPNVFDGMLRMGISRWGGPFIWGKEEKHRGKKVIKYNQYEDSPLYAPKDIGRVGTQSFGPYEQLIISGIDGIDLATDIAKGKNISPERKANIENKLIGEMVNLAKILPFRGDIAKTIRRSETGVISGTPRRKKKRRKVRRIEL